MKKYFSVLLLLLVIPMFSVHALDDFQIVTEDKATSVEEVNGSSVIAGNIVDGDNKVNGIGMLFGNTVNFNGISDYGVIAGNVVNLKGTINNDGIVLGNVLKFEPSFNIDRDLFIFGQDVVINGNFNRNVTVFASNVVVEGNIVGNLTINASSIELKSGSIVGGVLKHNENASFTNKGTISNIETTKPMELEVTYMDHIVSSLMGLISTLVVFIALALLVPALFKRIENKTKGISVVSSFAFIFGASLGLLLLVFYIMFAYSAPLFSGYFLGNIIWDKFIKKEKNMLLVGLLGIVIIYILEFIPVVGSLVTFLSLLIGLGLILKLFKKD